MISPTLLRTAIAALIAASAASAAEGKAFAATCDHAIRALRAEDWKAFQKLCAGDVVFENISRIYLQEHPKEVTTKIFASDWMKTGSYEDEIEPSSGSDWIGYNDRDAVFSHLIQTARPPSKDERAAFKKFCAYVKDTYSWQVPPVSRGLNLQCGEVKSLFGPAIEGKVVSNFKWRVGLEKISGQWRVRTLATESH